MRRKQKRELGILMWQIAAAVLILVRQGAIVKGMSRQEIAILIALRASEDDDTYKAWEAIVPGGADWGEILEIILKILNLILPLFFL